MLLSHIKFGGGPEASTGVPAWLTDKFAGLLALPLDSQTGHR
jgi:hypothetical protein